MVDQEGVRYSERDNRAYPISKADVDVLRAMPRISINQFTGEQIKAAEN